MNEGCQCSTKPVDVAHQPHYESQVMQPIEYMESSFTLQEFKGFLKGNILKYISRYEKKDGLKDLKKAQVYLNWLIQTTEDGKIKVR